MFIAFSRKTANRGRSKAAKVARAVFGVFTETICVAVTDFDIGKDFRFNVGDYHTDKAKGVRFSGAPKPVLMVFTRAYLGQYSDHLPELKAAIANVWPKDIEDPVWSDVAPELKKIEVMEAVVMGGAS